MAEGCDQGDFSRRRAMHMGKMDDAVSYDKLMPCVENDLIS